MGSEFNSHKLLTPWGGAVKQRRKSSCTNKDLDINFRVKELKSARTRGGRRMSGVIT